MTQHQLATLAGISNSHLSHIEAGRYNPSPAVMVALAAALECDIADITHAECA